MRAFTCPICGGKLNIKIGTEYAACDSCGNVTKIDPADAKRFTETYRAAERSMRLNSLEGYEAALRELDSISFIEEARRKRTDCEKRLNELRTDLQRRQAQGSASEQQNTSFAGVLLAVTLVLCAAALAGVAWLVVLLLKGALSPRATAVVVAIAALAILSAFINRGKSSNP